MFSLIAGLLEHYGVGAVAALMLIENLIPIIPSELILPFAGFEVAQGRMPGSEALIAATVASTAGAFLWYELGRRLGFARTAEWVDRHGLWTTLTRKDVELGCRWFSRWGGWSVLVGRTLPGVRSFTPVPAGVAGQSPLSFLAWSAMGALLWSAVLMALGFVLQANYAVVKHWMDPALDALVAAALLAYVLRVLRCRRLRKRLEQAVAQAKTGSDLRQEPPLG